jgi:hypothetical protein
MSAQAFEAPRSMATGGSSFLMQSLGLMCFGFDLSADTLPCNPSFIAMKRDGRLKASIFLGNNVSYTQEASDLLNERASEETIRKLFSEQDRSEFETNLEAGYWGQTWGAAISPLRVNYMTTFRNPALPEITLFASQEESARLQFGTYLGKDLFTGVQLRAVHRKFISKQFFLTDALANEGDRFFETDNQNVLYIEPGLLYAPENHDWNPLLFLNLVNFGLVDKTQDAFPMRPQYHIGSSVALDVGLGRWGFGIDVAWDNNVTSALEPVTLASFYEFGILRLMGHISERSNSLGFQVSSGFFNLGLASQAKTVDDGWDNKITDRRLYLLLGAEI